MRWRQLPISNIRWSVPFTYRGDRSFEGSYINDVVVLIGKRDIMEIYIFFDDSNVLCRSIFRELVEGVVSLDIPDDELEQHATQRPDIVALGDWLFEIVLGGPVRTLRPSNTTSKSQVETKQQWITGSLPNSLTSCRYYAR